MLDPDAADDALGCVDPIGEAGGEIAAHQASPRAEQRQPVQITAFAPGLTLSISPRCVKAGQYDMTIGGGVER